MCPDEIQNLVMVSDLNQNDIFLLKGTFIPDKRRTDTSAQEIEHCPRQTKPYGDLNQALHTDMQRQSKKGQGQRTQDGGSRTQDRGPRAKDPGERTHDRRPMTEDPGQRTQAGPRREDPGTRTLAVDHGQMTKDLRRKEGARTDHKGWMIKNLC
ncbi:hypothetical protein ACROYT_G032766 [Oculina patagonica]